MNTVLELIDKLQISICIAKSDIISQNLNQFKLDELKPLSFLAKVSD